MSMLRKRRLFGLYTACIFFLCLSAAVFLYKVSSASATTLLAQGTSDTCTWKYENINGDVVFTLYPTWGREGTLEDWISSSNSATLNEWQCLPSWHDNRYHEQTKRVIVRGAVKPRTCQNMFMGFRNAEFFDLSGLDVTGVNNMKYMFYGCSSLPSLDLNRWNVSCVTNMDGMFCWNSRLNSLDLNRWNVSCVETMNYMFRGCSSLASLDVNRWDVSRVIQMIGMFDGCSSLASLDVNRWDVSHVTCMSNMFSECSALTSLDLRGWDMSAVGSMSSMFQKTPSLKSICIGRKFCIHSNAAFDQAGSDAGTCWMQVSCGNGGTRENPRGKVFTSANDLLTFHVNRRDGENGVEEYVRIVGGPTTIIFDKGSREACGTMCPQVFAYNEKKALIRNNYQLCGHDFCGWIDSDGNFYADGQTFDNTCSAQCISKVFTARWKKNDESTSPASAVDSHADTYTVRFDVNIPSQENASSTALSELVVEYGKDAKIPDTHRPVRANHIFLGWNTRVDGRGGMYMPGASIDGVKNDITLYAQWREKDRVKLTYAVHENRGGSVSCADEEISDYADIPKGCIAQPYAGYVFKKWACTVAGCTWFSTEPTLKKEQIDLFAKRNGFYVSTTFTAYFEREVHEAISRAADDESPAKPDESSTKPDESPAKPDESPTKPDESSTKLDEKTPAPCVPSDEVQQKAENKIKLSYTTNDSEKGRVSRDTETVFDTSGVPRGSFAHPLNDKECTFVKWTCDADAEWQCKDPLLEREEIEKVAKNDGAYTPTTFTAHFEFKVHTIKFDTTPYVLTVKNGESIRIPSTYVPTIPPHKTFSSWNTKKDGTGAQYQLGEVIHTVVGSMTLYPQWDENRATLTYTVGNSTLGKVSIPKETIFVKSRHLQGSFAHPCHDKKDFFTKWTCDVDPEWSCEHAQLSQEDIDKVAKKDDAYISVTFTAHFAPIMYTVAFDTTTYTLTAEYGKSVQIPESYEAIQQIGKKFIGWNTKKDDTGESYKPGDTIAKIVKDMILYPQWEEITVVLTYKSEDLNKGRVSREREDISVIGASPRGSYADAVGENGYVFDRWTCDIDPEWVSNQPALEVEEIEKIATKDGLYVPVIFTAHFRKVQEMTALP